MIYVRNLPLNNVKNIRDLGGYSSLFRSVTCFGRFIRSAAVANLTDEEIDYLLEYGVKTVIDLRGKDEIDLKPNTFSDIPLVKYYNVPIVDFYSEELSTGDVYALISSEDDIHYLQVVNNFESMNQVFNIMAESDPGVILFNCELGMHRTGLIAAILLMLAEVTANGIEIDYSTSYTTLDELTRIQKIEDYNMPKHLLKINQVINYMVIKYGTVVSYFKDIGISEKNIQILKNKLLEPNK